MNLRDYLKLKKIHTKKEEQKAKRLLKSKLPFDLSWFVKWSSSFILLGAMVLRGAQQYPFVDLCMSFVGCAGWLWVGIMWKDRALIMLNTAAVAILGIGIVNALAGSV